MARHAQRLLDREGPDCVEHGYLKLPIASRLMAKGDHEEARTTAAEAAAIGDRYGDQDLQAFARSFEGRALIRQGRLAEGLQVLDEAMVAATSPGRSPFVTGLVYCFVIAACQQCYALDRAREWTHALAGWCGSQPQLVPFAGACLVHRSEILQLQGAWIEAEKEAHEAATRLSSTRDSSAGPACYQEAEMHRLRGEHALAEAAYGRAAERGRDPQPGLALLRLAQGRVDAAASSMRRALSEIRDPLLRARLLPAHVEIMLATADLAEARPRRG